MELIDSNETNAATIYGACESLAKLDPTAYSELSRSGITLDLTDSVPVVRNITRLFQRIQRTDIDVMPASFIHILVQEIHRVQGQLHDLENMELQNQVPENILLSLESVYEQVYQTLGPIIAHARPEAPDAAGWEQRLEEAMRRSDAAVKEIQTQGREADDLFRNMQDTAAKLGVSQHGATFDAAAKRHADAKRIWMIVTVVLGAITAIVGWFTARGVPDTGIGPAINFVAARLIIFGVLSYLLVWAGRTYRAEAHNQVVNEHRRDALRTFETFAKAATDDGIKNAVLTQATQCIFSHRPSGFGLQESDVPVTSHMLELTRNVVSNETK